MRATTPTSPSFFYLRQDTEGRSFTSDQIAATTNTVHALTLSAHAEMQITPKVGVKLDEIFINDWHYAPTGNVTVPIAGGTTAVPRSPIDQQFLETSWFIAGIDYDVIDELTLTLGYYNLQNYLSYQGEHRTLFGSDNIWWSPDARFFFTVTANLDAIYARAAHLPPPAKETVQNQNHNAAQQAVMQQVQFAAGQAHGL